MEGENSEEGSKGEEQTGSDTMTLKIKKDNLWKYSTFVLIGVVVIMGFFMFTGGDNSETGTGNIVAPTQPSAPTAQVVTADADDDAVLGDPNAPVTIIEFSDYQCPFCGKFWSETLPLIKSEYIDTGKVKYVFRDFTPTFRNPSYHPQAINAAMATECVREEGGDEVFYEYHDVIFANQGSINKANLIAWADDMGYEISECLESNKHRSEVEKDFNDGAAAGVQGTPSFLINGKLVRGAQPFSAFKQVIDAELA
ncbi:disulfide bond formation protein DsbA [Candidatus Pacearchaeota archaeon]|nr:disulfide bond formation protein DsbA [Candidatus Pacearchaeota archaeon]|tara:strand:+ start:7820 stop:8581 length:762 start_codon:yes stop_codon:yes gene_type:complete